MHNRKSIKITSYPEDLSPVLQLISTADMKTFLRVDSSSEDALIADFVQTATQAASEYMRRCILTTTFELTMDGFSDRRRDEIDILGAGVHTASKTHILGYSDEFGLPRPPIQSITSVKTFGTDNSESTFSGTKYQLDEEGGRIYLNQGETWPVNLRDYEAVKITYVAGYATIAEVPKPIIQGVKLWAAAMYEKRGYCECPDMCKKLLDGHKLYDNLGFC